MFYPLCDTLFRKFILVACGATVKTLADIQKGKGRINVDCCLFSSTNLPPHVVSLPSHVSKMNQFINEDVPRLDVSWVHQSIIQRKRLPLTGDERYSVSLSHTMTNSCRVSSIKSKAGARYEVGDLVQFSRGHKMTSSRGRIVGITFERQNGGCKLEVQILVRPCADILSGLIFRLELNIYIRCPLIGFPGNT